MDRFEEKRKPRPRLTCGAFTDKEHTVATKVIERVDARYEVEVLPMGKVSTGGVPRAP